jgi:FtsP/CotA-like multicopper oxidase with cupredoxin domain
MAHSMHFHGYHVKILSSEKTPQMNGWIKDSFPVKTDDKVTILLVPDKDGMYPVHDHNLIATTNIGLYPGGMIVMLNIMP